MSVPFVPVSPSAGTQEPTMVSSPQQHKILHDIQECIKQLREEFSEHRVPINDDNQVLHRFCAKLEYLLQTHMKEKYSMLGRKKDYWDYIVESLSKTKGLTDGIKYVKSLGEHKTSLGKGRAFLRFSLVHHRLPDSIQQCAMNPRISEWYHPQGIWFENNKIADLIGCLYDLNDVNFDLSPKGYDLDNSWPSFAKNQSGNFNWNPPSRRSSIGSLASLQTMDSSSIINLSSTPDNFLDVDRLTQNLESSESVRLDLQVKIDSLEQEKMEASRGVWSAQGELHAITDQLKELQTRHDDLLQQYQDVNKKHDKLLLETEVSQNNWKTREALLLEQCEAAKQQQINLDLSLADLKTELESSRKEMADILKTRESETSETGLRLKMVEQELELAREREKKDKQQVDNLEEKVREVERRNEELLTRLEDSLHGKEKEVSSQLETASRLHDLIHTLKQRESENVRLSTSLADAETRLQSCQTEIGDLKDVKSQLENRLESEKEQLQSCRTELCDVKCVKSQLENSLESEKEKNSENLILIAREKEEVSASYESEVKKLKDERTRLEDLYKQTTEESDMAHNRDITLLNQLLEERNQVLCESFHAICKLCSKDACDFDKTNMATLNKTDLTEKFKLFVNQLSDEKNSLESKLKQEQTLKTTLEHDLHKVEKENWEMCENFEQLKSSHEEMRREKEKTEKEWRASLSSQSEELASYRDSLDVARTELASKTESYQDSLNVVKAELASQTELLESSSVHINEMRSELEAKTEDISKLKSTLDRNGQTMFQLISQFSGNSENLDDFDTDHAVSAIKLHIQTLETKLSDLTSERDSLSRQLLHQQSSDTDRGKELCALQESLKELQDTLASSRVAETDLKKELAQKESEARQNAEMISELEAKLEKLNSEFSNLTELKLKVENENASLRNEVNVLQQSLSELSVAMTTANDKLQQVSVTGESVELKNRDLQDALKAKESKLEERLSDAKLLEAKVQSLSEELEGARLAKETSDSQKSSIESELTSVRSQKDLLEGQLKQVSELLSKETTKREETEAQFVSLSEQIVILKEQSDKLREELESKEQRYLEHEAEREQLTSQLEDALSDTGVIKTQLTDKLRELEDACSVKSQILKQNEDLMTRLRTLDDSYQQLEERLRSYEESGVESESLKQQLEEEKLEMRKTITTLNQEIDDLKTSNLHILEEKAENEKTITTLNQEIDDLKTSHLQTLEEKDSELSELQSEISRLQDNNEELTDLEDEKSALEERVLAIVDEISALRAELNHKDKMLSNKVLENANYVSLVDNLKQCVSALESSLAEKSRKCEELEKASSGQQTSLQVQVESLTQEITALQFQLSAEQLQHQEALKSSTGEVMSLSDMQARMAEQEALIAQLEQEVMSQCAGRSEDIEAQRQQLSELQTLLHTKDEECQSLIQQVQSLEVVLEQEQLAHRELQVLYHSMEETQRKQLAEMTEQNSILKSDRKQLTRKLIQLVKDKDVLWQKTDQLTYDQKVKANEKWMDSGTVTHCLACNAEFSIWLRKHHCRLCGHIFCYSCSDFWVLTAHSSKKERACENCYNQRQALETDTNSSILSHDSDDEFTASVTAVVPSISPHQSSSSNSSLNITDSELKRLGENIMETSDDAVQDDSAKVNEIEVKVSDDDIKIKDSVGSGDSVEVGDEIVAGTDNTEGSVTDELDPTSRDSLHVEQSADSDDRTTVDHVSESPPRVEPEDPFHVITDEEVTRSLTEYDTTLLDQAMAPNMQSSMVLSAEELAKGEINSQNEVWVKPGKSFAVPVSIQTPDTVLFWEFSSQPKDIVFSVNYRETTSTARDSAVEVVPPCKCDSHKHAVHGEITAKQTGIYTLLFDNSYSKITSKKVHYILKLKFNISE
ncbi:FYVE and coiled-coil domain-containing protein 1-like isoform X2 [Gigantopelta aegis]|uniref:FYVE and coiled-coil domain-containing protein 1-like isoform X2 n=1 Tax=Gigantopelta aegis TaxID=1735272 RepID=UPI001B88D9FF|nr:FYVE and coiled-coil domain-containing protein 1-like isoform X2 [Gigantopelta aegis]